MTKSRHLIFGDFLSYALALENITRLATLFIWRNVNSLNLIFGAGIEASFRVIKPNRCTEFINEFAEKTFQLYQKAIELKVPE